MYPYIPNSEEEEKKMLEVIGISSVDKLFSPIPEAVKLNRSLNLNSSMSELQVTEHIKSLADKNVSLEELTCFLGAGAYDHYVPSVVNHLISRSEFYTSYTPYQAEISQGTLQAIFEYETMIADLTGLNLANASMYDGATACAEAAKMAVESTKRKKIIISKTVNPEIRKVMSTIMKFYGAEIIEADMEDGITSFDSLKALIDSSTAGVLVQYPNFFGIVEDLTEVEKIVHQNKALLIGCVDPIALGILKSPGEIGIDIAVGEGQALGNRLNFGGPYLGFMATTTKLMRKMPGRIVGESIDVDGKRAYVLTLQAREQHIRREKANSNICSNQSINALSAAIYLSIMGKQGLKEVAEQSMRKAHYAYNELISTGKYKPLFGKDKVFFKEFAIACEDKAEAVNEKLLEAKILGGYVLQKDYPELKSSLLFCVTEKRTRKEIDNLVKVMEGIR